jgi:hypothetical protein
MRFPISLRFRSPLCVDGGRRQLSRAARLLIARQEIGHAVSLKSRWPTIDPPGSEGPESEADRRQMAAKGGHGSMSSTGRPYEAQKARLAGPLNTFQAPTQRPMLSFPGAFR